MEIQAKYSGYIHRQADQVARLKAQDTTPLPDPLDYDQIKGLSNEARQKLKEIRPQSIGQASPIPRITPAAISILLVYLRKKA